MEWKCFFTISAYIMTVCDPVLGATGITNVMLADGLTPNEGRVEYDRPDIGRKSACGDKRFSDVASVVCRQLGYEEVNNIFVQSPFGQSTSIDQQILNCDGDEENLTECSLFAESPCSNAGGVICYESGYIGCYTSVLGVLQTPCKNGVQDLTIPNCVSLCHHTDDTYTYAGLNEGNMCYCWSSSATVSHMDKVDDKMCSSPCVGREIEKCGGDTQIALFNITLYQQNTNRTASPPGCSEPTPTQTEGDVTTTVSIQSPSSPSTPPPQTTPPPPPPPPASSSSPPPPPTVTPPSPPSSSPSSSSSSSSPPMSSISSPPPTTPSVLSTDRTMMEVMTPGVSPRSRTPTGMTARTTRGRTTQTGVPSNLGLYIGAGAGGGILLLIIIILLVVFIIRRRRKVPTRTKENEPDPYMDLQPRPEADRTYQEMAITSTASSPKNRRKSSTIIKPVL